MNKLVLMRFSKYIELDLLEGCWLWKGTTSVGYGQLGIKGKVIGAHRLSYEHWNGKIPNGLQIDHLCRNRSCVNPQHLEAVTPQENLLRGNTSASHNSKKTHCKRGHEFTLKNTKINHRGHRECRICNNMLIKNWKMRQK